MPDYDRFRATADRLIRSFGSGTTATITRRSPGAYDPLTDTDATGAAESQSVPVTVVPLGAADQSTKLDDLALTESAKALIPDQSMTWRPAPGDTIVLPGRAGAFSVIDVKPVAPDGTGIVTSLIVGKTAPV